MVRIPWLVGLLLLAHSCTITQAQSQCTNITSCQACASQNSCGYCDATGICDPGTSAGSNDGTCSGSSWAWSANNCAVADPCNQFNSNCTACGEAPTGASCGYCWSTGVCSAGTASGPTIGINTCASTSWIFGTTPCPTSDSCNQYNNCNDCWNTAPVELSCGWCADTRMCSTGTTTGPAVAGCSSTGWSWDSCGSAAQCEAATSCFQCLEQTQNGCGWCKQGYSGSGWSGMGTCVKSNSVGTAPYSPGGGTCPAREWAFDDSYSGQTVNCYLPSPYDHDQATLNTTDYTSLSLLGFIGFVLLIATLTFSCCGCQRCIPVAGEGRKQLNGKERLLDKHRREREKAERRAKRQNRLNPHMRRYDGEDYSDEEGDAAEGDEGGSYGDRVEGSCCKNFNVPCGKFILWLLCLLNLGLVVAALATDLWSLAVQNESDLSSYDNPLSTAEGTLQNYVWLGEDHHDQSTFQYDCSRAQQAAGVECMVHYAAGVATLVTGVVSALFALILTLMATSDFCCAARYTPQSKYNPIHILRVQYPFSVNQWRCAVIATIYAYLACATFGVGCFLLSQQYYSGEMNLHVSWYLMLSSAVVSNFIALLYRRALRVTPRDGYSLVQKQDRRQSRVGGGGLLHGGAGAGAGVAGMNAPLNGALGYPGQRPGQPVGSLASQQQAGFQYQSFSQHAAVHQQPQQSQHLGQHGGYQQFPPPLMQHSMMQQQQQQPYMQYHPQPQQHVLPPQHHQQQGMRYPPSPSLPSVRLSPGGPPSPHFGPANAANHYMQVPWHMYAGEGASHPQFGGYAPPAGYILVPASQAAAYLNPQSTSGGSAHGSPKLSPAHVAAAASNASPEGQPFQPLPAPAVPSSRALVGAHREADGVDHAAGGEAPGEPGVDEPEGDAGAAPEQKQGEP